MPYIVTKHPTIADKSQPSSCIDIAIHHGLRPLCIVLNAVCNESQDGHVQLILGFEHDPLRNNKIYAVMGTNAEAKLPCSSFLAKPRI